jgi:hypothetical protein
MTPDTTKSHRPPLAAIVIVPLIAALVLTLFAWPAAKVGPRDLPVGVAGPPAMQQRLAAAGDRFDVHRYADEAAARAAIEDREVYGAFVATPEGPKVLTASAASPAVAQLLTHGADGAKVEDVVPAPPAGNGLSASVLPLVLAGILTGAVVAGIGGGAWRRIGLLVTGSVLTGVGAALIVQSWLGVVGGDFWANAGVLGLTVLAISATIAGLEALLGKAGIALGALTMVFIGNPFSGVATSPDMLPAGAGVIGQLLPPGAGGNLLRSTGFFDGAAAGGPITVLVTWALAGFALLGLAALRGRRTAPAAVAAAA